jgi:tartrate dehydratase alpha subunit/fumarate hydratase class I-like protein
MNLGGFGQQLEECRKALSPESIMEEVQAQDDQMSAPDFWNDVETANKLGIGPMGFGGATTLLGCKVGVLNRLPASFFVSVSYMCWAYRRQGAVLTPDGSIRSWLY